MNRTVIIGAIIVLLAAAGWYQFSYKPNQVDEAVTTATEGAAATTETATEAVEGAADATTEAVEGAADATTEAAEGAAEATTEATEGAAEATTEATEGATDAATGAAAALDPATFDPDAVVVLIDGSTLDDATKTTLKTAVEAARTNPALVADTVAQVRTALGL